MSSGGERYQNILVHFHHAYHLKMDPYKTQEADSLWGQWVRLSYSADEGISPGLCPQPVALWECLDKSIWLEVLVSCGLRKLTYVFQIVLGLHIEVRYLLNIRLIYYGFSCCPVPGMNDFYR